MDRKSIENHIKKGIEALIPDLKDKIWEIPVEKSGDNPWFLKNNPPHK